MKDLDETIVHELLHLAMRGLDVATNTASNHMSPVVGVEFDRRLEHEREKHIERLTRAIIALHAEIT